MTPAPASTPDFGIDRSPNPGTLQLERLLTGLENRLDNLSPKQRYLAEGIIKNVRRSGSASEAQRAQILRLEQLSKTKWRGEKYRPRPANELPTERYYRRLDEIHATDYGDDWRQKLADMRANTDELEAANAPVIAARSAAERKGRRDYQDISRERAEDRAFFRARMVTYDRVACLPFALPGILQPHLMNRLRLIRLLRRRRKWLVSGASGLPLILIRDYLPGVRVALASERLALWRDMRQAQLLQAAE